MDIKRNGSVTEQTYDKDKLAELARLAIGVPRPPMLTPSRTAWDCRVKPESRSAAGTLLITWLVSREVRYSRPSISLRMAEETESIRARFPDGRAVASNIMSASVNYILKDGEI